MKLDILPRFEVEKLPGTYKKMVHKYVPVKDEITGEVTGRTLTQVEVEVPKGWMVYFPNGSSIHVPTEREMRRLKFDQDPTLIEMNSGEEVEGEFSMSLKSRSARKTRASNRPNIRKAG